MWPKRGVTGEMHLGEFFGGHFIACETLCVQAKMVASFISYFQWRALRRLRLSFRCLPLRPNCGC